MEKLESFSAGTSKYSPSMHHLQKMKGGAIIFCRRGWALFTINLKQYEVTERTQILIMPGSILGVDGLSDNFLISYFEFSCEMFMEASIRLDPPFFHFIGENPCYKLPPENTGAINGLMAASAGIYEDSENRFQLQIMKNHLQSFLLDIYDKCHRFFTRQQIEGGSRQDEIFMKFIALVHEHCISERDVTFYANQLCISTKYLTGICQNTTGNSAKKTIDDFVMLEIKVLLQTSKMNIQEIADQLNFPDQSYLGRYFKRHEGMSPKEYQTKRKM